MTKQGEKYTDERCKKKHRSYNKQAWEDKMATSKGEARRASTVLWQTRASRSFCNLTKDPSP